MTKTNEKSHPIIDQGEIEIIETQQAMQEDISEIDSARRKKIGREVALKIVEKYLDGQEYNQGRITAEVRIYLERISQDYIAVGRRLLVVKQVEGHGNYMKWLKANFPLSPRSAQRFTQIALALERRPDLAPLAKAGVSKALVLLDLPDEYLDEAELEGTIDGRSLDEFDTMTRKEVIETARKLKRDRDRQVENIVAEETKGLKAENEALIAENKRLKTFEPSESLTPEQFLEQIQRLQSAAMVAVHIAEEFVYDEKMVEELSGDIQTQAKIEFNVDLVRKAIRDFDRQWNDTFNPVDL